MIGNSSSPEAVKHPVNVKYFTVFDNLFVGGLLGCGVQLYLIVPLGHQTDAFIFFGDFVQT